MTGITPLYRLNELRPLVDVLRSGGVIAYPTEGVFGLGCDPDNIEALERIRKLKNRSKCDGFIVLGDAPSRFASWVEEKEYSDPRLSLSGVPTTWLVALKDPPPLALCGIGNKKLAVRVAHFLPVRRLCRLYSKALVSTSANPAGKKPATGTAQVLSYFDGKIDAVLDVAVGDYAGKSSRIIDLSTGKVLRDTVSTSDNR